MGIRVVLADDHAIVREGLKTILERNEQIQVVGEAEDGRSAVVMAGKLSPDVLVMDVGMPEVNGIEATRQIKQLHPNVRVVALSTYSDKRYVLRMLEAGACGYVLKAAVGQELLQAVMDASVGKSYLSSEVAGVVIAGCVNRDEEDAPSSSVLGAREREALQFIAEGKSSKEIAFAMKISVRTVEMHRRNIMRKLDLHSVAALTKYAIREGLTNPDT